jgi:hypothetical protein
MVGIVRSSARGQCHQVNGMLAVKGVKEKKRETVVMSATRRLLLNRRDDIVYVVGAYQRLPDLAKDLKTRGIEDPCLWNPRVRQLISLPQHSITWLSDVPLDDDHKERWDWIVCDGYPTTCTSGMTPAIEERGSCSKAGTAEKGAEQRASDGPVSTVQSSTPRPSPPL